MLEVLWLSVILIYHPVYSQYDLSEVLSKSILFYEAQRSGALPPDNRISWRGDSGLDDGSDNGIDLVGGWHDAGDHVKFGFPMAQAAMTLAWGLVDFEAGYSQAGELDNMRDSIRWPLDYFVKCHVSPNEFYAQVGDPILDHDYWGRPEQMTMPRPSFKLDVNSPGSDVAADTASALAAGYMAFQNIDPDYANTLLQHSRELYDFAYDYRGLYSDSIPEASDSYRSYIYEDELCLGGAWLYRATGEQAYLDRAREFYDGSVQWAFSWDDKMAACQILMYILTTEQQYADHVSAFISSYSPGGSITYTPGGLAWRDTWGSLRYTANTGFIAALAYKNAISQSQSETYLRSQIGYILGNNPNGRSYVVGYGNNPPLRPHHCSSSCDPDHSVPCDWDEFSSPDPNPSVLNGALVGGPDEYDSYVDDRTDYIFNEVSCDYNAGFQSAIAGMIALGINP